MWISIAAKLGLAGRRRMGAPPSPLLVTLCSYAQPSELLPLHARQLVPTTSLVTGSWCAATRWTTHSNQSDGKGRVPSAEGKQRSSCFSVFLPPVPDRILESVPVPQSPKTSLSIHLDILAQHRSSNERKALNECKSRGQ